MPASLTTAEKNTFSLPRGTKLRLALRQHFAQQRQAILRFIRTGRKDQAGLLPWVWPEWDDFRLGALAMSERMTPLISGVWEAAGLKFAPRVGLDPDQWSVVNPHTAQKIREATLAFCDSTNQTTSEELDTALTKTRQELARGIIDEGESIPQLTKRVNRIFDQASKSKARTIAQTETARAVHAAQDEAARQSGVVTGWKWLASADACDVCLAIVARCPQVKLGQPFAVIGNNPHYSQIMHPPAHPRCNCTVTEITVLDKQPKFHPALHDPESITDQEHSRIAPEQRRLIEQAIGAPKPVKPVRKPRKPKPGPYLMTTHGHIRDEEKEEIQAIVESFPKKVLKTIADHGATFAVAETWEALDPIQAQEQPRGWPAGATWANTDGAYRGAEKQILVARRHRRIGDNKLILSERVPGVLRHETGHGFDDALGRPSHANQEFKDAYLADVAKLPHAMATHLAYYLQSGNTGLGEVFAEAFAELHGGGCDKDEVLKNFPSCTKIVKRWAKAGKIT